MSVSSHIEDFKRRHDMLIDELKSHYMGKEVTLINTHPEISRGRAAKIDGIIITDGRPYFLCMVLRSGSETEFLNGPGWSRSYRPIDDFILMFE